MTRHFESYAYVLEKSLRNPDRPLDAAPLSSVGGRKDRN